MKRMGAVESDSVKSARKAKDKLHKACERASETRERTLHGQEQNNAHAYTHAYGKHESHETVIDFTITCTAAPRVWHFSAFHCFTLMVLARNTSTVVHVHGFIPRTAAMEVQYVSVVVE